MLWDATFGGSGTVLTVSMAVRGDGGVLLAGSFVGEVDFGSAPRDEGRGSGIYVLELDDEGTRRWSRTLGAGGLFAAVSVAEASDDAVLLFGHFAGTADLGGGPRAAEESWDGYVVAFDGEGAYQWDTTFGGTGAPHAVWVNPRADGSLLLTGFFSGAVDFGGGLRDVGETYAGYVSVLDSGGAHRWDTTFEGSWAVWPYAVTAREDRTVVLAGLLEGTADLGRGSRETGDSWDGFVLAFTCQ